MTATLLIEGGELEPFAIALLLMLMLMVVGATEWVVLVVELDLVEALADLTLVRASFEPRGEQAGLETVATIVVWTRILLRQLEATYKRKQKEQSCLVQGGFRFGSPCFEKTLSFDFAMMTYDLFMCTEPVEPCRAAAPLLPGIRSYRLRSRLRLVSFPVLLILKLVPLWS